MAAPSGGGGGGGPVGFSNSFTGAAQALEIYGDFGSALSGGVIVAQATDPEATLLDFTSGNYLFVGNLQMFSPIQSGDDIRFTLTYNGVTIGASLSSGDTQYLSRQLDSGLRVLIPAYTKVQLTAYNVTAATNRTQYASMIGRIYRD